MAPRRKRIPDVSPPVGATESVRLQILLEDYSQCRDDERTWTTVLASFFAAAFALVGLLAAAVTQTCRFNSSRSCTNVPDLVVGAAPMLPIALIAYMQVLGTVSTIRSYYMRGIEEEIRGYAPDPVASVPVIVPVSYTGIVTEVLSMRRGQAAYRALGGLLVATVLLVFGGLATYIGLHMGPVVQAVMTVVYGPLVLLLAIEIYRAGPGGRSMFIKVARGYFEHQHAAGYALSEIAAQPHGQSGERSLLSYLLLPRVAEWVKWLIMPGAFATAAWAAGSFREWPRMVLMWLVLEYLIYEARYQWNDIRGLHEDIGHPESRERRRLPGREHPRRNILVSSLAAVLRLVAAIVVGIAAHLLTAVAVLIGAVFGVAIVYEALRGRPLHPRPLLRTSARSVAIWLIAGAGYAIRSGTGLWLAGFHVYGLIVLTGMLYMSVFGIMLILLIWVFEAASYCGTDGKDILYPSPELSVKPHVASLLRWTGWKIENGSGSSPGAEERVIARKRAKPYAPWNIAFVLGAGLGALGGIALAHPDSQPSAYGAAGAVGVIGALALVISSGIFARLALTGITAAALAALAFAGLHGVLVLDAAIPWIAVAAGYAFLSESSYRDLMTFAPWLVDTIATKAGKIPLVLLRFVIGSETWQSAGFGRRVP